MFEHLGIAGEEVLAVHGAQEGGVEDDGAGIGENTDLVFQSPEIKACLAAHGGIDHGEQCGGDVDVLNAALEGGGGETTEVGDHTATEIDHERMARGPEALEFGPDVGDGVERLVGVGVGYDDALCVAHAVVIGDDGQTEPLGGGVDKYKQLVILTSSNRFIERLLQVIGNDDFLRFHRVIHQYISRWSECTYRH